MTSESPRPGSISEVVKYFLKLGLLGFGGPVALVGQMERELVSEKQWMSKDQMREAIAICEDWINALCSGAFPKMLRKKRRKS